VRLNVRLRSFSSIGVLSEKSIFRIAHEMYNRLVHVSEE
jgi:hypothetical protein